MDPHSGIRRTTIRTAALSLATGLLFGSCTPPPAPRGDPSTTHRQTVAAASPTPTPTIPPGTVAWTRKGAPAGLHVLVGDALVGYVVRSKRLVLRAIDARDGSLRWQRAASPGNNPPGVSTDVATIGDKIIYLTPFGPDGGDHYWTRIVVVDAMTGDAVSATSRYYSVDSFPEPCGHRICFNEVDGLVSAYSMDPSTGAVKAGGHFRGRAIGDHGLVELVNGADAPKDSGRFVHGKIIWRVPFAELFADGFQPDGGWQWEYDSEEKLFVGEVGYFDPDQRTVHPDRESMMVGVDAATGKLRWREVGTTRWCPEVDAATMGAEDDPVFRCRYAKGSRIERNERRATFHDVRVSLERFDPGSGRTRWSATLPHLQGRITADATTALRVDDDHVMIKGKQGPAQVNLRSGVVTRLPRGAQLWCSRTVQNPYLRFYSDRDSDRNTGTVQFPCTVKQKHTKIRNRIPVFVGEHDKGMVYVTQEKAVVAYRQ